IPIQSVLLPRVIEADDEDRDEDDHLDETSDPERTEEHRPREEKDDLDVEHDEEQSEDIEVGRISAPCLADGLLARFVRAELFLRGLSRRDEASERQQDSNEAHCDHEAHEDVHVRNAVVGNRTTPPPGYCS